ncbi:MAG: ABC transporter permease [Vicinamibacterales bacterium]
MLREELRDAWRGLRAAPGTSILALAILTVGIAAATVTFSVVDTVALRRLPFPDAGRLTAVAVVTRANPRHGTVAPQDFFTWQEHAAAFEKLAAVGPWSLTFTTGDTTQRLRALRITANLFDVLKVQPALGGGFTAANENAGADQVVILSHAFWTTHFGADPNVIGRQVAFGRETRQVVGVMPRGFTYPIGPDRATEVWIPHVPRPRDRDHGTPGRAYDLQVVGRLRPGTTVSQAQEQVSRATAGVIAAHPNQTFWKDARPIVMTLHDYVVGPAGHWLVLVLGAVALVLVIGYVNVANLLLARATARARELAIRTALGAARARITRMLMLESLILSLSAATFGIVLAHWGVSLATASLPTGLARASTIALDMRVLSVAIAVAVATGIVFGAVPAWQGSRADVMSIMKEGTAIGTARGRARWQRGLLVAELAFVVTLLITTSLFVTSFVNVVRADLGFARDNLVGFRVSKSHSTVPERERASMMEAFVADMLTRAESVPGVVGVALVDGGLPLFGEVSSYSIKVPGHGQIAGADMLVLRSVTPRYFDVAGIRFLRGRTFEGTERSDTPRVAIINDEAERRFFGGRNPVGEIITFRGPTTIVGVVSSVRLFGPERDLRPELYVPLLQEDTGGSTISGDVLVRFASQAGSVAAVQEALKDVSGSAQPPAPRDIGNQFRTLTADRRFNAGVMGLFGLLALGMAAAGVYGLMSFVVMQQRRTIGVRLALGATRGRIFRGVLANSGRLLLPAIALGLVGGWASSRLFASVVFGVTGNEVWLYAVVAGVLGATAAAATLLPAHRASRVDPLVMLRAE